jgi:hypothetical protein
LPSGRIRLAELHLVRGARHWEEGNQAQNAVWIEDMKRVKHDVPLFAVCINNAEYPASLQLHNIYRVICVIPDEDAAQDGALGRGTIQPLQHVVHTRETTYPIQPRQRHPDRSRRARASGRGVARSSDRYLPDRWLRKAEKEAGLEPQTGSLWHAFRRKWATERKHPTWF